MSAERCLSHDVIENKCFNPKNHTYDICDPTYVIKRREGPEPY